MTEDVPKYASVSREKDYSNLLPTYSYVGSLDPFLDEAIQYINNLNAAGVNADLEIYKGAYHAFDVISKTSNISQMAWG